MIIILAAIFGSCVGLVTGGLWASFDLIAGYPTPSELQVTGLVLGGACLMQFPAVVLAAICA